MTVYSADREELNEQIRSYQEAIGQYNTRTINAIKATNYASSVLSVLIPESHLLKVINTSDTDRMIEEIKIFWDDLVNADKNTKNRIDDVQKGVRSINERTSTFMDLLGNKGSNLHNLKPLQLYETMWLDDTLIKNIINKLQSGEQLNSSEQELLYHYFQNDFLTEADIQEIETIASYINVDNIDQLKYRLNEKVIISEEALLKEIEMLQAYLYLGNKRSGDGGIEQDIREKLNGYLLLLENYKTEMNDDVFHIVDELKFDDTEEGKDVIFLQSALETIAYKNRGNLSKEQFRELFIESRPTPMKDLNIIESMYYPRTNAGATFLYIEKNKLNEKLANYSKKFLLTEFLQYIIPLLGKGNAIGDIYKITSHLNKIGNSNLNYQDTKDQVAISDLLITSITLEMNFNISNSYYSRQPEEELHVKLYPTDATYMILDRWKLASIVNEDIPYPAELIESQDWYEIDQQLNEILNSYSKKLPKLEEYIMKGVLTNTTVEKVATEK